MHIVNLGQGGRHRCADLSNCIAENALDALAGRVIPPGKGKPSTRRQDPNTLCQSHVWSGKMAKPKSADDCIERVVSKWEMFDVSLTKVDCGV
jgi:hypothetical protein